MMAFYRKNPIQQFLNPFIILFFRIIIAFPFFNAGLTKFVYVKNDQLDTLYFLFEEYNVPFISVKYAALLATAGELILPVLLTFGFLTRSSAFGLLLMSGIIYSVDQNPHAIYWAGLCMYLVVNGANKISIDYMIRNIY